VSSFSDPKFQFENEVTDQVISGLGPRAFESLKGIVEEEYPNAILATLFKNTSKSRKIFESGKASIA
jgi:hypothetical protein